SQETRLSHLPQLGVVLYCYRRVLLPAACTHAVVRRTGLDRGNELSYRPARVRRAAGRTGSMGRLYVAAGRLVGAAVDCEPGRITPGTVPEFSPLIGARPDLALAFCFYQIEDTFLTIRSLARVRTI